MDYAIYLGLFFPLIGFLILLVLSDKISRWWTGFIGCSSIFLSFLCFTSILYTYVTSGSSPIQATLFNWIPVPGINAGFTLHIDQLSLLMTLIITGVGFLIHVYSNGYIENEEDYARFFACLNFFVFMMLLLVLAANLLLLFVGWEGVGLASYLLIGYWYTRPSAAQAATKAFVVNRIGDWGFLVGLLLTLYTFGTSDIAEISQKAGQGFAVGAPLITILTLLLFFGATGKSAQLPLHTWLPDAMEGPTPVSALIHAATMVTAGVYLVVRMHTVFELAPLTLLIVGIIGAATALFAALCALGQIDLKRVLAYSTVSQLGYMFLACGVGAFYAAMFHLTMHAFVKALLFLSAGNVVHMMHGSPNMEKMGGLAAKFPKTHWLFLIGILAMSGVPPLAAFFSKDLILEQGYLAGYNTLFIIGLITSVLTAFYLTRAYCLTFTGHPRLEQKILKAVKEAPHIMLAPVSILAILSIIGGFLGYAFGKTPILQSFLEKAGITLAFHEGSLINPVTIMATIGVFFGLGSAAWIYTKYADRLKGPIPILKNSFYVDQIYWVLFVLPIMGFAKLIDKVLEPKLFDGMIRGLTRLTQGIARVLQQIQSGQIRSYVAWMVLGSVLVIAYFVLQ